MADIKLVFDADTAPVDRAIRLLDNLEAEIRDVERAEKAGLITKKRATAETAKLNQQIARLNTATRGSAKDFRLFEKSIYGSGKALRQKEIAMQQAGYQLQDFIVQVQAGTNPLIAFSQQGSQLAGFFAGPWGAAIGLGIAALGGLGTALLGTKSKAEEVFTSLNDLVDLKDDFQSLGISMGDSLGSALDAITAKVGKASADLYKLRVDMANFSIEQATKDISTAKDFDLIDIPFSDRTAGFGSDVYMRQFYKSQVESLLGNIGGETVEEIDSAFSAAISGIGEMVEKGQVAEGVLQKLLKIAEDQGYFARILRKEEKAKKDEIDAQKLSIENLAKLTKAEIDTANESLGLQKELKKESINRLAALTTGLLQEANLDIKLNNEAKDRKRQLFVDNLSAATDAALEQANYEINMTEKAEARKRQLAIDTANFQFSLVQDTIGELTDEQDALNDAAEQLGVRLGIGFESALKIIRDAKREATVGLDAFGGAGDFKYSVPTTFDPDKDKTSGPRVVDPLADLQKQVELEQALIGKTEARQRIIQALGVDLSGYSEKTINDLERQINKTIQLEDIERKRQEALDEARQKQQEVADTISNSMENAMMSIVDGTKSVKDAFKSMAAEIIKDLYRIYVVKQITGMVSDAISLYTGAPVGQVSMSANGNVFSRGSLIPYANGGIVGSPTYFPMAGGRTGLMGEAGPEAIMPLKRGKNGKLGVQVDGGQQQSVVVNQSFNFQANGDDSVKRIIAQQAPKIAQMTQQQIMDSRRRGGQMKAVFG